MFELKYVTHFDELTWIEGAMPLRYHECRITFDQRSEMLSWFRENMQGKVLVWPGLLTPPKIMGSVVYEYFVAPDEVTCYFAFFDPMDETRYSLEFVGRSGSVHRCTHKDACTAYHDRRGHK